MKNTPLGFVFTSEKGGEWEVIAESYDRAVRKLPKNAKFDDWYEEKVYHIGMLKDDGSSWKVLKSFWTYSEADLALDTYQNRYPNALIEIV